ncbi:MAG: aminotransferase class I/II-fold pyridoxal phosphate-dependent enzyme [Candidatus Levybacteria bacterium]|nr:aminotransferase class I/II-fold pyridoxal phosphate-dependent enzyme [Candidatus Levybacteria bacterium]
MAGREDIARKPQRRDTIPSVVRELSKPKSYVGRGEITTEYPVQAYVLALAEGFVPFDASPELNDNFKQVDVMETLSNYALEGLAEPELSLRERFKVGSRGKFVFSSGGNDEILERIVTQLLRPYQRRVLGLYVAPYFTNMNMYAKRWGTNPDGSPVLPYYNVTTPLTTTVGETVDKTAQIISSTRQRNLFVYLCNPNTPKGDSADIRQVIKLVEAAQDKDFLVVIDEDLGDALEDNQSAIPLTHYYNNLIVVRSMSKYLRLPGLRSGYAAMSKDLYDAYTKVQRPHDMNSLTQAFTIIALRNEIALPHLERTRQKVVEIKTNLLSYLNRAGVNFLPTDPRVPIFIVDGKRKDFHKRLARLRIETLSGSEFIGTHRGLTGRFARMSIPKDPDQIPVITYIVCLAAGIKPPNWLQEEVNKLNEAIEK